MDLIAYGEDGLTLWAMSYRTREILRAAGDGSPDSPCLAFYRPSFGRKGGTRSAQFGEFDFILLSREWIYLGESKWDRSPEWKGGRLPFRQEQTIRHTVLRCYIESWFETEDRDWMKVLSGTKSRLEAHGIGKPTPPRGSRLEANTKRFLTALDAHFGFRPNIKNILLFFYEASSCGPHIEANNDFKVVKLSYEGDGDVRITL